MSVRIIQFQSHWRSTFVTPSYGHVRLFSRRAQKEISSGLHVILRCFSCTILASPSQLACIAIYGPVRDQGIRQVELSPDLDRARETWAVVLLLDPRTGMAGPDLEGRFF